VKNAITDGLTLCLIRLDSSLQRDAIGFVGNVSDLHSGDYRFKSCSDQIFLHVLIEFFLQFERNNSRIIAKCSKNVRGLLF